MSRRSEPRVEMNIDVTVWGMDRYGKPFVQHARTLNATKRGARLLGIDCVRVGETVGIQHGEQKSRFRVVWVGREDTPRAGQLGVQCLEDQPIFTLDRRINGGEMNFAKISGLANAIESARHRRPNRGDSMPSRRRYPRYNCTGGVELRRQEDGHAIWGNLSDLCLTGCYVETVSTLPPGNQVLFQLRVRDITVRGRAVVKTSHHAVGMGLSFQHLSPEDQQHLEFLVGGLAGSKEVVALAKPAQAMAAAASAIRPQLPAVQTVQPSQPAPSPQPITSTTTLAAQPSASTTQPPTMTASVVPVAATPTPPVRPAPVASKVATPSPPKRDSNGTAAQIIRALTELSEMEHKLVQDKIDARLIVEFHDALEHARQTAWSIQRFVDLSSASGDPFAVLPQLEVERARMLIKFARNVSLDMDAAGMENFGPEVTELYKTLDQLQRRLSKAMAAASGPVNTVIP